MESQEKEKVKNKKGKKGLTVFLGMVVLALVVFLGVRYYYVFGTGVKSGQLNYVVYKGYVFKTSRMNLYFRLQIRRLPKN